MNTQTLTVILIGSLIFAYPRGLAAQPPEYTVCEVLARLPELDGKIIRVRGIAGARPRAGYLRASHCDLKLTTEELVWPNEISLAGAPVALRKPEFEPDESSRKQLYAVLTDRAPRTSPFSTSVVEVPVVIEGQLEYRMSVAINGNRQRVLGGLGPVGQFPAQLIIKSVPVIEMDKRVEFPQTPHR